MLSTISHYGGIAVAVLGLVYTITTAPFVSNAGPVLLMDMATTAWYAAILGFFGLLLSHNSVKPEHDVTMYGTLQVVYYGCTSAIWFVIGICQAIYGRYDHFLLALLSMATLGISLWLILARGACGSTDQADTQHHTHTTPLSQDAPAAAHSDGAYDGSTGVPGAKANSGTAQHASASSDVPAEPTFLPCYTADVSRPETRPCWCCCLGAYLVFNMAVALLFSIMLTVSSVQQANWIASYPPRGDFVTLDATHSDGIGSISKTILYHCEGPSIRDTGVPLLLIDADASHGSADFWPLQAQLTAAGRRSCSFDKLGLGFSDRYSTQQDVDPMTYYSPLVEHLLEEEGAGELVLVGWGGGASIVYEYAMGAPAGQVRGLVFVEAFSDGIEWRSEAFLEGWGEDRMNEYKDQDLAGRRIIFSLLRGLAVPWGLAGIFVPFNESNYALPARFDEYKIQYTMPKTWTVQWFTLKPWYDRRVEQYNLGVFNETSPEVRGMPVLQIMSNRTRAAICDEEPEIKTVEECDERMRLNAYMKNDERLVANTTGNASFHFCTAADCGLDMPLAKPEVVVQGIMDAPWVQ